MKTTSISCLIVALAVPVGLGAAPQLLPFQGQLSDPAGAPLEDGARVIQFKLYDAPVGGTAVWAGEVHKLSVNGGLVNTMLGTQTAFPERFGSAPGKPMFSEALYLEITVDGQSLGEPGYGIIDAADPPLLPRQILLPANFAHQAGNAEHAQAADMAGSADYASAAGSADTAQSAETVKNVVVVNDAGLVPGALLQANSVHTSALIAENAITHTFLAPNSVRSSELQNGAVQPSHLALEHAVFSDQGGQSTQGGSAPAGWSTRRLTSLQKTGGSFSRSGNIITLAQGTYIVDGMVPAHDVDAHVATIAEYSGGSVGANVLLGTAAFSRGYATTHSYLRGFLKVTDSSASYVVRHWKEKAQGGDYGLGTSVPGSGVNSVKTMISFTKIK